jgi:hypothetical protein
MYKVGQEYIQSRDQKLVQGKQQQLSEILNDYENDQIKDLFTDMALKDIEKLKTELGHS